MAQDVAVNDEEQRGEHIRRYAELIEAREAIVLQDAKQIEPPKRGRPVSVASKIAAETGLSYATVHRVLDPKPVAEVFPIVACSEQDAVLAQANAIMWLGPRMLRPRVALPRW